MAKLDGRILFHAKDGSQYEVIQPSQLRERVKLESYTITAIYICMKNGDFDYTTLGKKNVIVLSPRTYAAVEVRRRRTT